MRALTARDMLTIWERGVGQSVQQRALTILSVGFQEISIETLLDLSIGQRDRQLTRLRARTLGPLFSGLVICPSCREQVEITFTESEICSQDPGESNGPVPLRMNEHVVTFRPPTTADLLHVESVQDPEDARRRLIHRCVMRVQANGNDVPVDAMTDGLLKSMSTQIEKLDSFADVRLQVSCAACHKQSQILFDISRFFWSEIAVHARRLLSEVHLLARAYAWSEEDILSMSAARRGMYLDMVS